MVNQSQRRRIGLVVDGLKTCTKCKSDKSPGEFHKDKNKPGGLTSQCKTCTAERARQAQLDDPDRFYFYNTKRLYGIDKQVYLEMLSEQGGGCKICLIPPVEGKRLCVDHCAETGKVRGLLCAECNRGIGFLRHDVCNLQRAIEYLL